MLAATPVNKNNFANTEEEDVQVDAGEISYHIVQLVPYNSDLLDITTTKGKELEAKKYDVSNLNAE